MAKYNMEPCKCGMLPRFAVQGARHRDCAAGREATDMIELRADECLRDLPFPCVLANKGFRFLINVKFFEVLIACAPDKGGEGRGNGSRRRGGRGAAEAEGRGRGERRFDEGVGGAREGSGGHCPNGRARVGVAIYPVGSGRDMCVLLRLAIFVLTVRYTLVSCIYAASVACSVRIHGYNRTVVFPAFVDARLPNLQFVGVTASRYGLDGQTSTLCAIKVNLGWSFKSRLAVPLPVRSTLRCLQLIEPRPLLADQTAGACSEPAGDRYGRQKLEISA